MTDIPEATNARKDELGVTVLERKITTFTPYCYLCERSLGNNACKSLAEERAVDHQKVHEAGLSPAEMGD